MERFFTISTILSFIFIVLSFITKISVWIGVGIGAFAMLVYVFFMVVYLLGEKGWFE